MDWQAVGDEIAQCLQTSLGAVQAVPLQGGDINQAFRLESERMPFFVKLNRADLLPMFEAEQVGLDAIRLSQTIRVPEVFVTGRVAGSAYIVMEYIELGGRADAAKLASALAAMHASLHDRFGFQCDNTIGSTPQVNPFTDNWVEFWRCHRLGFQLELLRQRGFDTALIDAGASLSDRLGEFFHGYQPQASLLHGDLWSGNQAADRYGNPVIYDPACYYGDHEADLAMMELFGRPGDQFFAQYREHFPIDAGYPQRRDLYNLYHIVNHALLFGGGYALQARRLIDRLLSQL